MASLDIPVNTQTAVYGTPFNPSDQKLCVVEFSATWCGPCIRAVPHLVQLQKELPKVPITSIFACPKAKIESLLGSSGINYVTAVVDRQAFSELLEAVGANGIPHAAILVDGKVVYCDHPMQPTFAAKLKQYAKEQGLLE